MKLNKLALLLFLIVVSGLKSQVVGTPYIVPGKQAKVLTLDCPNMVLTPSAVAQNQNYSGTMNIPYTAGNGGAYPIGTPINSTGVTGLTATLQAGTLTNGSGNISFSVSGSPNSVGTANFAIAFGGQSCTTSITVTCPIPQTPPTGYTDKYAILYKVSDVNWDQLRIGSGNQTYLTPTSFATAVPYNIIVRDDDALFGATCPLCVDSTPHTVISTSSGLSFPANSRMSFYSNRTGNVTVGGQPIWSEGPVDIDNPGSNNYSIQGQYSANPEQTGLATFVSFEAINSSGKTNWYLHKVILNGSIYFYLYPISTTARPYVLPNNATSVNTIGISLMGYPNAYPGFPNSGLPWNFGIGGSTAPIFCN